MTKIGSIISGGIYFDLTLVVRDENGHTTGPARSSLSSSQVQGIAQHLLLAHKEQYGTSYSFSSPVFITAAGVTNTSEDDEKTNSHQFSLTGERQKLAERDLVVFPLETADDIWHLFDSSSRNPTYHIPHARHRSAQSAPAPLPNPQDDGSRSRRGSTLSDGSIASPLPQPPPLSPIGRVPARSPDGSRRGSTSSDRSIASPLPQSPTSPTLRSPTPRSPTPRSPSGSRRSSVASHDRSHVHSRRGSRASMGHVRSPSVAPSPVFFEHNPDDFALDQYAPIPYVWTKEVYDKRKQALERLSPEACRWREKIIERHEEEISAARDTRVKTDQVLRQFFLNWNAGHIEYHSRHL